MEYQAAADLAQRLVCFDDLVVNDAATVIRPWGWVFLCNSKDYVESRGLIGDDLTGLVPPVFVDKRTGQYWVAARGQTLETMIQSMEEYLTPNVPGIGFPAETWQPETPSPSDPNVVLGKPDISPEQYRRDFLLLSQQIPEIASAIIANLHAAKLELENQKQSAANLLRQLAHQGHHNDEPIKLLEHCYQRWGPPWYDPAPITRSRKLAFRLVLDVGAFHAMQKMLILESEVLEGLPGVGMNRFIGNQFDLEEIINLLKTGPVRSGFSVDNPLDRAMIERTKTLINEHCSLVAAAEAEIATMSQAAHRNSRFPYDMEELGLSIGVS